MGHSKGECHGSIGNGMVFVARPGDYSVVHLPRRQTWVMSRRLESLPRGGSALSTSCSTRKRYGCRVTHWHARIPVAKGEERQCLRKSKRKRTYRGFPRYRIKTRVKKWERQELFPLLEEWLIFRGSRKTAGVIASEANRALLLQANIRKTSN